MRQEQPPDERFIVEFSEMCEADLDTCYLRLSRVSPEVAARWQKGILAACFSLSQFPRRRLAGVQCELVERWNEGILSACQSLP